MKGTIRKRGAKFQVVFPYKDNAGEWKQKSATFATKGEANAKLKEWNYETEQNTSENPYFSKVAELWIEEVKLTGSRNTVRTYNFSVDFILGKIEDKPIQNYKRSDFVALYKSIAESGYEISAYKNTINMIMNFAIKSGFVSMNPAKGIATSRTNEKKEAVMLNRAERYELLQKLDFPVFYCMAYIMLKTGLRIGETMGLDWNNIDFSKKEMRIVQQMLDDGTITSRLKSKNSKRTIMLDTETIQVLKKYSLSPYNSGTLLFPDRTYRGEFTMKLFRFGLSPHDLRHNHGTDLLDICNIADAAKRMGHTVDEYVKTYIHDTNDAQIMIADKLSTPEYSLFDKIVTEVPDNVVKMADISARGV